MDAAALNGSLHTPEELEVLERERAEFFEALAAFNQQYDVHLARAPIMGGHKLDLCGLFNAVLQFQGFERVQEAKKWRELAHQLGVPRSCTSATAQLRSNYLKYLYAYECWKLHGLTLSKADLADRQRMLANKGETRALGIHEEAEGGGLASAGSPGDPNAAARGVSSSNSSMPGKHSAPMIGGRGARGGGNAGGGGQIIGGMRPGGMGGIGGVYSVGRTGGGPAAAANQYKGSAAFGAAIPHAKGAGGGMGPNSMQHRQPTVPAGIPPSALTSYPSALPVKGVCTPGAGGVDGQTSVAPQAPGYWFRQKRLWNEMDDATPPVAKATYPQEATRRLFETSAARFARSVELGAEPDFSYTISALSVLSADTEVPLWDPFATQAPHQLMLALCRAVHDCGRQSKVLESFHYKRFSAKALEDTRCDWLLESSPALNKRGDHALDVLDRAMSMLRILYNFASGHAHLARALAADREAVVLLLRTALPPYTGSDLIREQALRVLKLLAGHIPDAKTTLQCFEVYLSLLGQFGGSLPPAHVSQALQGLCSLARRAEGLPDTGDKMAEMSRRHGMLAWVDDHCLLHPDPEVRFWCLRTLEAMARHRAPPTAAAKAAAAERTRAAAAARAAAADDAAGAAAAAAAAPGKARVFEAERGAAFIAPEAARLRNLTGVLVLAAVQSEHWGLRGVALRVLAGLSSLQPHEPLVEARPSTESAPSGSGEAVRPWRERLDEEEAAGRSGKYAFVEKVAEHAEAFAEVMLADNVSDDNARAAAKLLGNIRRFRQWESALSAAKLAAVEEQVAAKPSWHGLASTSRSAAGALGSQGPEELTDAPRQPEPGVPFATALPQSSSVDASACVQREAKIIEALTALPQSSSVDASAQVGSKAAEADGAAKAACVGVTMGSAPAGVAARAIAIAGVETTGATWLEATVPSAALSAVDSAEATVSQERWHAAASDCGDAAGTASTCATAAWDVAEPHTVAAGGDGVTSMVSHASLLETGGRDPAMAIKADSTAAGARRPDRESAGVEGLAAPGGTWTEDGQGPAAELEDIGNLDAEQTDPWSDHGKDEALF